MERERKRDRREREREEVKREREKGEREKGNIETLKIRGILKREREYCTENKY